MPGTRRTTPAPLPVPAPGTPRVQRVEIRRQGYTLAINDHEFELTEQQAEDLYYELGNYVDN